MDRSFRERSYTSRRRIKIATEGDRERESRAEADKGYSAREEILRMAEEKKIRGTSKKKEKSREKMRGTRNGDRGVYSLAKGAETALVKWRPLAL